MLTQKVNFIQNWKDPEIRSIRDDCMLKIANGVYFHQRLQVTIIVEDELPAAISNWLPK